MTKVCDHDLPVGSSTVRASNFPLERTAGSHALATAAQRGDAPTRAAAATVQSGDPGWLDRLEPDDP